MAAPVQFAGVRAGYFWAAFAVLVAASWVGLLAMSLGYPGALAELGPGMDLFERLRWLGALCAAGAGPLSWTSLWQMWTLMAVAMMSPVAVPHLAAYRRLGAAGGGSASSLALASLLAGYLAVWVAYAAAAAGLQLALAEAALMGVGGAARSPWLTACLLLSAAAWQWTPWKEACLAQCRNPFAFFLSNWRGGAAGAFRMGVRQGAVCAACCWALMLLALVGGVMNVLWMVGATALMIAEKLPDPGGRMRRGLGAGLAGGAIAAALAAAGVL